MEQKSNARELGPAGIRWDACPGVWRHPERMSGAWCFDRSRVPVSSLFENMRSGMPLDEYLLMFPMQHDHNVSAVLRHISERLQEEIGNRSRPAGTEPCSIDWRNCRYVEQENGEPKGKWVFNGTRTPVADWFEHLAAGGSPTGYSEGHPEVSRRYTSGLLSFLIGCLDEY